MEKHELQCRIERLHGKYQSLDEGEVVTYIPELGKANPDDFGLCRMTADGRLFEIVASTKNFTI